MEISQFAGFSELPGLMEDPCFNSQWPITYADYPMNMEAAEVSVDRNMHHQVYAHATVHDPYFYNPVMEASPRPSKQLKTSSWNSCLTSLMNQNVHDSHGGLARTKKTSVNTPQDHILAERKRREKLSQRFIALSALVPGLKKMDKASVLGEAIKYLKTLQEKVKALEEQTKKRSNVESVVIVKRYEVVDDDSEKFSGDGKLPEIEARFSGKDVLIRIHCEKKTKVVEETLAEIERHHLSVINTCSMAFADYALDITIVAQMDQEFNLTMKELVRNLRTGLKQFM